MRTRISTRMRRLPRICRRSPLPALRALRALLRVRQMTDVGMTTAEYAIGTLAACAFAGVLIKILTSAKVADLLTGIVTKALSVVS
jgi:hypothetical protein